MRAAINHECPECGGAIAGKEIVLSAAPEYLLKQAQEEWAVYKHAHITDCIQALRNRLSNTRSRISTLSDEIALLRRTTWTITEPAKSDFDWLLPILYVGAGIIGMMIGMILGPPWR